MNGVPAAGFVPIAVADRSAERLSTLFDTHYDRLYRLARRLVPTADDARDVVQGTFLKAASALGSVPTGRGGEEAWLVRVLINICRDEWRRAAVRQRHRDELRRRAPTSVDDEAAMVARAAIWRALDVLTPRRRAIVVMRELEGLPIASIASLLGITAITVRWHLSMGRRDLARVLEPIGGSHDVR